jgi:adenylate cyclase
VTEERVQRRLAAILAADMVGYSAMMERAEESTYAEIGRLRREVIEPSLDCHKGRLVKTTGDGILAEFASPVSAVRCGIEIQEQLAGASIQLRIGVNLGDVIVDDQGDIYGDGINIAVRLEGLADPGGILISGKVHSEVEGRLDATFEDRGERQLKNISKPVHAYAVRAGTYSAPTGKPSALPPLPDKPSIAVLPFQNMSGDPEQEYFSDGITDDIITELSRFSDLFVIARNSSFQYKGKSTDVREIGRELGVGYVLEGGIRRVAARVRINAQLIDATTGTHCWAERYDRQLEDVFAVQDELARTIAAVLAAQVNRVEAEHTLLRPPATWQAYDFYMRAADLLVSFQSTYKLEELYEARRLLERCLALDANYARAHAAYSFAWIVAWINSLDGDFLSPVALDRAHLFGRNAVQLDRNLPQGHAQLGYVLAFEAQHELSIAEFERAIELNPNFTDRRFAIPLIFAGQFDRAVQCIQMHKRADPFYFPVASGFLGLALYMLKRYSEALTPLLECVSRAPNLRDGHVWLAATYAQLERPEQARQQAAEVLRIEPTYTTERTAKPIMRFRNASDADHLFDGLHKAGLPRD